MSNINFQYPSWFILLCLGLGVLYALMLYYKSNAFRTQSGRLNFWLGLLRFCAVTFLAILLLEPFLRSVQTDAKKPILIVAQDQSESVVAEMDEAEKAAYTEAFQNFSASFDDKYELHQYAFGSEVREEIDFIFEDKVSNISDFLGTIYDLYSNQNLGAVVLATDGIYNEGSNPIYASTKLSVPIYTVALGDTTPSKDLVLKRVFHNKIAYLDDQFSIQIDVGAQNCANTSTRLTVSKVEGGTTRLLHDIPITIDRNDFFSTQEIVLDANESGVQRYRLRLAPIAGEERTVNNVKDIFVDVLDARQKVLILANSPHPDVTALRQNLNTNKNYQVSVAYINDLDVDVKSFDFVILHQLPSFKNNAAPVISLLNANNIPRLYIVGSQTDLLRLNTLQNLVGIVGDGRNTDEVQANLAKEFNLFNLSEKVTDELYRFPPLIAPFGQYRIGANAQPVLFQRIGKIDTRQPLLVLGEYEGIKTGILCAEGVWKWRLFDYLQHQNHDVFEELMGKTIQYLSVKEDKRRFRVSLPNNIIDENEAVIMDAELYNSSYELVNEPDASVVVTDSEGKEFNFTFNKTNNAYTLNAGIFPVGNYRFTAEAFYGGEKLSYSGQFSVQPIQLEAYETTADHNLLRLLSEKYGGEMVYPSNIASLTERIASQETIVPVLYETVKTQSVLNLKWIFFVLLALLTLEWFFRRYFGSY